MEQAINLILSITDSELDFISKADYGQNAEVHRQALEKLIFQQKGVVNPDQYWCPYEVVELSHSSLKKGHEREFAICNVIIALSIIAGNDSMNSIESMFEKLANDYQILPIELREIVTGILFLAAEFKH